MNKRRDWFLFQCRFTCDSWLLPLSLLASLSLAFAQETINVDIQVDGNDSYSGPNAAGQSNPIWNHAGSDQTNSLVNSSGSPTAIGLTLQHANGRWKTDWSTHDLLEDFMYRDANAEGQVILNGLNTTKRYHLHVYTGVEGGQYRVGSQVLHSVYSGANAGGDPAYAAGTSFVQGKNVVTFKDLIPDDHGTMVLYYRDSPLTTAPHGNMAGFTLEVIPDLSIPIHVDIQAGSSAGYAGSSAFDSGTPIWNHVSPDVVSGLVNARGEKTAIGLDMYGANGREVTSWTTHALLGDYLYRDRHGTGNAVLTGFPPNMSLDLVLYSGPEGGKWAASGRTARNAFSGTGVGGDPAYAPGAAWVEGKNFVVLRGVTADGNGNLHLTYGDNPDDSGDYGLFAGFSVGKAGTYSGPSSSPVAPPPATSGTQVVSTIAGLATLSPGTGSTVVISGLPGGTSLTLRDVQPGPPLTASRGDLYWLGFPMPIASVEWIPARSVIRFNADFGLPFPLFTDDFNNPIRQSVTLEVDVAGKISIIGGNIFIKELKVGKTLQLANLALQFDSATNTVGGSVEVAIGNGKPDPCSPGEKTYPFVGGFIKFRNGQLDTLTVGGSNLRQPVGAAYLDLIQATIRNLTDPKGNWEIEGRMLLNGGCPISIPGADVFPVTIDAQGKYSNDRTFSLNGQGKIFNIQVAEAGLTVTPSVVAMNTKIDFAGAFNTDTRMTIDLNGVAGRSTGTLRVPDSVGWGLGGMTFANTTATLDGNGITGSVSVLVSQGSAGYWTGGYNKRVGYKGRACTPIFGTPCWDVDLCCVDLWIPKVWVPAIPEVRSNFGFSYSWSNNSLNFLPRSEAVRDPWDDGFRPRIQDPESGGYLTLMTNWERLDRSSSGFGGRGFEIGSSGQPESVTDIPEGTPSAIFRLNYTAEDVEEPSFQLTLPSGTILTSKLGGLPFGYENAAGYSRSNPKASEVVILLYNPAPGPYKVVVDQSASLGDFSVDVLGETTPPFGEIVQMEGPDEFGLIEVLWFLENIENPAEVSFYLQPDSESTSGGILLESDIRNESTPEDDIEYTVFNLDEVDAPPGLYYIMLKVNDGNNEPYFSYSDYQIEFDNPEAPDPIWAISSVAGDRSFTLEWEASDAEDLDHYAILYSEELDSGEFEHSIPVGKDVTRYTLDGLENGKPYLVTVVARDVDGWQSFELDVHRIIPSRGTGLTPPVIVSTPDTDATAEHQYAYFLLGFDGDEAIEAVDLPDDWEQAALDPDSSEPALSWTLVAGPDGMTLDPSGLLLWTPRSDQVGEHDVIVQLSKPYPSLTADSSKPPLTTEQHFKIQVLDAFNLNGLEENPYTFISTPPIYTEEGEIYTYKPQVLGPDEDTQIIVVFGPDDMYVNDDNEVVWDVPTDAPGTFVWLRGFTSDGFVVEQFYFLHVHLSWNRLPQELRITQIDLHEEDVMVNWIGSAPQVVVQRADSLESPQWKTISDPIDRHTINLFTDRDNTLGAGYYRVVETQSGTDQ